MKILALMHKPSARPQIAAFAMVCYFILNSALAFAQVTISANPATSGNLPVGISNYHASECIYTATELGTNFTTVGTPINTVGFTCTTASTTNTTVSNFKIYFKDVAAATTTFTLGAYTTSGYTLVYNGSFDVATTGVKTLTLSTPYVRSSATMNLQMLIERTDNLLRSSLFFATSNGNDVSSAALTSRRYNSSTPLSGTSALTASNFRPAIVLATLCATPTTQPSSLTLTAASASQINGSFTAATGAPSGYLVVRYASGASPTNPVDAVSYATGNPLGTGTVVAASASTTFSSTGLSSNSTYNYKVFSYNNTNCDGGLKYFTTAPLLGSQSTPAVLAVEFESIYATAKGTTNVINFTTASEKNNEGFDIERSVDGTAFQKIGFVKGNGTTNQPQQYTYTDALVRAVTYYRLKQLDTDGKFDYSKVVSVENNGDGLRVYPTLVSDGLLTVQGGQSDDCIVMNLLGQPVWMGKTTQQLDVSTLAKGTYLLKVGSAVTKFVKQ
jgi:hypothetical protein